MKKSDLCLKNIAVESSFHHENKMETAVSSLPPVDNNIRYHFLPPPLSRASASNELFNTRQSKMSRCAPLGELQGFSSKCHPKITTESLYRNDKPIPPERIIEGEEIYQEIPAENPYLNPIQIVDNYTYTPILPPKELQG